jgi:hypothetical protein
LLAEDPWATRMPAVIGGVPNRLADSGWQLRDAEHGALSLLARSAEPWPLVAVSRGEPVPVFGELTSEGLVPLAVLPGEHGCGFVAEAAA